MPEEPITPEQEQDIKLPAEGWSDELAKTVVLRDFSYAENYRTTNHDWRFRAADELYLGWVSQKYWEGTRVPRSSIGVYMALEQIESLLPKVLGAIFQDNPWFDCDARPGTTTEEAADVNDLLIWQLEEARIKEQMRRSFKDAFVYGNGIVEVGWKAQKLERRRFVQDEIPIKKTVDLSQFGFGRVQVPTGKFKRRVREEKYTDDVNMPFVDHRSIKDCYIDPNCQSPDIADARYFIHRAYKTADDLKELRDTFGFEIPDDATLARLAKYKPSTHGDWTKGATESYRSGWYNPQIDSSADPASKRIEVLAYWTKNRLVWILNREQIVFNQANPYGFIPFFNCFYVDVPDRFYGLSVCDIVEGDQRLIVSILNARVDELALSLHPTRIKRRGLSVPQYSLRRRPGQLIEAENPKEDIVTETVQNITEQAYVEVEAAERRVQKATGVTDLAVLGAPSSGGNSASRTATGVGVQAQASSSRIQYLVAHMEDNFIEPILNAVHTLNIRFLSRDQIIAVIGQTGQKVEIDPMSVLNANIKFSLRASAKMQSRMALLQSFPLLAQTFLNPEVMQALAQQQKKVDVDELMIMLIDATGYQMKRNKLITDMTPQEIQAMQQQADPAMQKVQMEGQVAQAKLQLEGQTTQQKMQLEHEKHQSEMQMAREKHHMQLQMEQAKGQTQLQIAHQQSQTKQQVDMMQAEAQIYREQKAIDKGTEGKK